MRSVQRLSEVSSCAARIVALVVAVCFGAGVDLVRADEPLTFERHVRPILKAHCFHCHGEESELKGNLDVRLKRLLDKGGDGGPAVVAGKPDESPLLERIVAGEMPPGNKPVPAREVELLRKWIEQGAITARAEPDDPAKISEIAEEDRAYWFFQPVKRPEVPVVQAKELVTNEIDAFLLAKLEPQGLSFAAEADKRTLIRRAFYDLIGLPPTPERVDAFVADTSPDAYAKLIEELLASPHYGERWGRHWLDVAGYADSEGYTIEDHVRPDIYRYRDYVIRAFNSDKPFDRFVTEQLAGDELVPPPYWAGLSDEQKDCLVATGFLRMAPDGTAAGDVDQKVARNDVIAETIKIVSTSLLGLTVGCAQCHTHRYDPIPQTDYYRMRALFEPAYNWKEWKTPGERKLWMTPADVVEKIKAIEAQAVAKEAETKLFLESACDKVREKELEKIPAEKREAAKVAVKVEEAKRTDEQKTLARDYFNYFNVNGGTLELFDSAAFSELRKRQDEIIALRATKPPEHVYVALTEPTDKPLPETFVFHRGDPDSPRQAVLPGDLSIVEDLAGSKIEPKNSSLPTSGRRLAFAKHLTSGQHPLLGRVLVNRFWMHHFGKGIVSTPGDFGRLGALPTHPELLDWLASEFVSTGWSLKAFHRKVLLSRAWRQSSVRTPKAEEIDPDNKLLSHMSLKRLEAEAIRDAMLDVAGKLNRTPFGPAVPVAENDDGEVIIAVENIDGNGIHAPKPVPAGDELRRSVYIQVRRSKLLSVLDTFDLPAMEPNCELRTSSTVTPQSLMLMNGDVVRTIARQTAERAVADVGAEPVARVDRVWRLALGRLPSETERAKALAFLTEQAVALGVSPVEGAPPVDVGALTTLVQVLFGSNEFLYVE
jgi:hypothetical protein